ncbi:NAD-glutamate dehydrogenase [Actinoalloteichus hymeniacidonis]|uniref:NAD-specific glutamate dehydrogenase n=1 Tax=Actinoalloteichus hymeniacidonis TaxID=340345 RepID=A0AAC9MXL9_9PSEU|nr:NAD-glutamate dehydrogenase [Actinoalloteichus hymeniacidonis]AOS62385.1 NAD-specific glutamate dehydrogenase [Actinoalloteichus hymeniacidonis]MBB5909585.1 glutamate dehydrogenase [Actinoalloteichus hymeniacidonis]
MRVNGDGIEAAPKHRQDRAAALDSTRDELLDRAADTQPSLGRLLRLYFRDVSAEEVVAHDSDQLLAMLSSHVELAQHRVAGRPAIRVFAPEDEKAGVTRDVTVVQIVTDDMPYLVESVVAGLSRQNASVIRIVHPIVVVRRDLAGEMHEVLDSADPSDPPADALVESWMHLEIAPVGDLEAREALQRGLHSVLNDVREVIEDTDRMAERAQSLANELESATLPVPVTEVRDGARLLRWLAAGHFTFLGYRHYELIAEPAADSAAVESSTGTETDPGHDEAALRTVLASGLGVLRRDSLETKGFAHVPDGMARALAPNLLVLTQGSAPSTVHRPVHPYYVGIKTFDDEGRVNGEHRFLGLFTTTALHEDVLDIPVVARKVRTVIRRAGFPLESYSGQRMLEEFQNYPRAELFSADPETLQDTVAGLLSLVERRQLRLFMRRDEFRRFFSCLVYLPRDRYTTTSRLAMQEVLLRELRGVELEYSARIGESLLARVHFMVRTDPDDEVEVDTGLLQDQLAFAVRTWSDLMVEEVIASEASPRVSSIEGEDRRSESAVERGRQYASAFSEAYKEDFSAADGLADLRRLFALSGPGDVDISFYRPAVGEPGERRFKLYMVGERVTLSQVLPILQRMGVEVVDERPYEVNRHDGVQCWVYDFGLRLDTALLEEQTTLNMAEFQNRFQDAFVAAWHGRCEIDGFNSLVLRADLTWRQAVVLRTYAKYLRQARTAYSQDYIEDTLRANPQVTKALVRLFETRFDPAHSEQSRRETTEELLTEITGLLDEVTSLDVDRILQSYVTLIRATLRTNYFVRDADGEQKSYLAIKLRPSEISDLPEPRPAFEIFVCSPRVEGVHLRFGAVARGGLRWSDRREDFRTEVLGLVKAQAVKNAVIVPVGAKGGFVVKRPPTPTGEPGRDRELALAEGIACYRMFISGLLDLTDNLDAGRVVPADQVVRHDGDDTYLVVAADKGTAKFSDIANEVAQSYGFWLGDAFASGGSAGYDHKQMGITAKGAWESVRRHFRELGVNTQQDDFTVVGVGDMSGDVFGNGMLLSEHIRLVAAFDHRHIFLDPEPDAATSFAERSRLYALPRSSWEDYDRTLISAGGGVWPRSVKAIPIGPEVRAALGLDEGVTTLSSPELVKAILGAPVDLLWNGGIGTYVKASDESHLDVGDKANDVLRVDGRDLRVKVVGEGGNLGLTQRGRIEFAKVGGKVNTDALDNSAGVDCSDHEVNIKILLDRVIASGGLDPEQRNALLGEMTDQVSELVLADNYRQNAVLGVSRSHAAPMVSVHARLVANLEAHHGLDRELEVLPSVARFKAMDKASEGLTSPELATLMAHVKLALKDDILAGNLPEAEIFAGRLPSYFPTQLRERFGELISQHPLRREIITTMLVNEVVDGGGVSYAFRLAEEMSVTTTDAVRAFAVVTEVFDLPALWQAVDELDTIVSSDVADDLVLQSRRLLDRSARWLLSNRPQPLAVGAEIARFKPVIQELTPQVLGLLRGRELESATEFSTRLVTAGVPAATAERVAALLHTYSLLDITEVAELAERDGGGSRERTPVEAAELYFAVSAHLDIDRILNSVSDLERGNRWHALARLALRDDVYTSLRKITIDVLRNSDPNQGVQEKIDQWEQANSSRLERAGTTLSAINSVAKLDLATLSVAARQIRSMVR